MPALLLNNHFAIETFYAKRFLRKKLQLMAREMFPRT